SGLFKRFRFGFRFAHGQIAASNNHRRAGQYDYIGCDDKRPMVHSAAIRFNLASTLVSANIPRIRISTIAPKIKLKPTTFIASGHRKAVSMEDPLTVMLAF